LDVGLRCHSQMVGGAQWAAWARWSTC
jgi:hypothetical protein